MLVILLLLQISGSHNVNGDSTAFPNNPDYSLYSGAVGNSWGTYVWVCTTAGNYDYQCDPHVCNGWLYYRLTLLLQTFLR